MLGDAVALSTRFAACWIERVPIAMLYTSTSPPLLRWPMAEFVAPATVRTASALALGGFMRALLWSTVLLALWVGIAWALA